jgi:hypothetical protein
MQTAAMAPIIAIAKLDRPLVEKKAELKRSTHRSPEMCDKVLAAVQGYEIIEERSTALL